MGRRRGGLRSHFRGVKGKDDGDGRCYKAQGRNKILGQEASTALVRGALAGGAKTYPRVVACRTS